MSLHDEVRNTVFYNKAGLTVTELAELLGISENYLYKQAMEPGSPGSEPFKLKHLIPLMTITGDYRILHQLALVTGHVCVRIPAGRQTKLMLQREKNELDRGHHELTEKLLDLMEKSGTLDDTKSVEKICYRLQQRLERLKTGAKDLVQPRLPLEG